MITLVGPATGGVAHVSRELARTWSARSEVNALTVADDGEVVAAGCGCPPAPAAAASTPVAVRAARSARAHRRCLAASRSLHLELGRLSEGAFWFGLAAGVRHRRLPFVVSCHDLPVAVLHPGAALVRRGPGWPDRLAYRVVAPLTDRLALRRLRRRAAATVVLSEEARRTAHRLGWPQVHLVEHGAAPATPGRPSAGTADYVLLAGHLGPGKGLDVLADAWARSTRRLPLVVAGGASRQHADWVSTVRDRLVAGPQPPTWLGVVDDDRFADLVARSAVVVIPYEVSNPASGVLVRALVEGRAVVGTRVPAVEHEVTDEVDALVVPPSDAAALAAALDRLTASPTLRDRLGGRAAATAAGRHSWTRHVGDLARIHAGLDPAAAPTPGGREPR